MTTAKTPTGSSTKKDRLIAIITARSFSRGGEVKLASGRTSNYYFNMKPTMLHPEGAHLIGSLILDALAAHDVTMIGGLEIGAVPLATAVAVASHTAGRPLNAFFVRKEAKDHGTKSLIEGLANGESIQHQRVAIIEDVTTTGGSALKAVEAVRQAGGTVALVLTVVDRLEGAGATFASAGLPFEAILTTRDFGA